ncbi:MAG: hypothetical protein MRY78_16850 [Saprospiraceae bacterium]|nr:hypothetical protein [Saprospiraceae bacterium]
MKYFFLLFLALSLMITSCGSSKESTAQPATEKVADTPQNADRRARFEQRQEEMRAALLAKLNLSDEQLTKFDEINAYYREKMQAIRSENQGDFASMRSAFSQLREEQDLEMEAMLTPEQYKAYKAFQEEQRANRRGRRGGRGGNQ